MKLDLCIDHCAYAAGACGEAWFHVRNREGLAADEGLLAALGDAARVSAFSADSLTQASDLQPMIAQICAEMLERAAFACARHLDVPELAACAETCAAAAAACRHVGDEDAGALEDDDADEFTRIGAILEAGLSERVTEIRYKALPRNAA